MYGIFKMDIHTISNRMEGGIQVGEALNNLQMNIKNFSDSSIITTGHNHHSECEKVEYLQLKEKIISRSLIIN